MELLILKDKIEKLENNHSGAYKLFEIVEEIVKVIPENRVDLASTIIYLNAFHQEKLNDYKNRKIVRSTPPEDINKLKEDVLTRVIFVLKRLNINF